MGKPRLLFRRSPMSAKGDSGRLAWAGWPLYSGSLYRSSMERVLSPGHDVAKAALLSAAFWAFTYLLFSVRSYLAADVPVFLSGIRMAATAVGAVVLWLLLVDARRQLITGTRLVPHVLLATAFAASAVWSVRVLYVALMGELTHTIEDNLRWAMLWAGYCGAAFALYLLAVRQVRSSTTTLRTRLDNLAARPARDVTELDQNLQWIVDAIAEQIATAPDGLNDRLAESLSKQAGYLSSDAGTQDARRANIRVEMIGRILDAYRGRGMATRSRD